MLRRGPWIGYTAAMQDATRDHGAQPLDELMNRWGITNHQLVDTSVEQLNHKQVQRARKGRQLTLHLMQKVTRTLNDACWPNSPRKNGRTSNPTSTSISSTTPKAMTRSGPIRTQR